MKKLWPAVDLTGLPYEIAAREYLDRCEAGRRTLGAPLVRFVFQSNYWWLAS